VQRVTSCVVGKTRDLRGNCAYEAILTPAPNITPSEFSVGQARLLAVACLTEKCVDQEFSESLMLSTSQPSKDFLERHLKADTTSDTYATAESISALAESLDRTVYICVESGSKAVPQIVGATNSPAIFLLCSRREHISPVFLQSKDVAPPRAFSPAELSNKLNTKLEVLRAMSSRPTLPEGTRQLMCSIVSLISSHPCFDPP